MYFRFPLSLRMVEEMLAARGIVVSHETVRQLMTAPGVGALVTLAYASVVDAPERFARSSSVGAYIGLTPRRYQSGEVYRPRLMGHLVGAYAA